MQKKLAQFVLSVLFMAGAQSLAAQSQALGRPVAIDKLPSGSLYALDEQGAVHAVDFPAGQPAVTGSFQLPRAWTPSDIVSAQINGQNELILAVNYGLTGRILIYTTTGQLQKTSWSLPNGVAGIAYDSPNSTLYVASGRSPEIFRINLSKDSSPEFFARTPGSQRLGPILFDAKDNALLVADLVMGTIDKVDIGHRNSVPLFGGLSSASAMRFSADWSQLFVSDDVARRVVTFSMAQPRSAPRVFARLPQFRSPSGLAWVGNRLAVSDDGARALFILSGSGSLQATLPAHH
jgi:DNA-binding beta-propeller fold protein YncE